MKLKFNKSMTAQFVAIFALTAALNACQTISDQAIVLDPQFSREATEYRLQRPTWTLKDEAYQQNFGQFTINEIDLSGKSMQRRQTSSHLVMNDTDDLVFQFLFHDVVNLDPQRVNSYHMIGEQDFEFKVQHPLQSAVHSRCKMLYQGQSDVTTDNEVNSYNWETQSQLQNHLGCVLSQNGQISELLIEQQGQATPQLKLHKGSVRLRIEPVTTALYKVGDRWTPTPMITDQVFGYNFFLDEQQVAAVTVDNNFPKLWLANQQSAEQQQWLVAVAYSFIMFDWHNDWQQNGRPE